MLLQINNSYIVNLKSPWSRVFLMQTISKIRLSWMHKTNDIIIIFYYNF